MRFRVALAAVLVFAVVDLAQGFGFLGHGSSAVGARTARASDAIAMAPAADATNPPGSTSAMPPPSPSTEPPPSTAFVASPAPSVAAATTTASSTTTTAPPPDAVVARVVAPTLAVYADPSDAKPALALAATTEFGTPRVLLVTETRGGWVQVMLPVRPNGAVGWVKAQAVTLSSVPDVLDVDLDAHTLTWGHHGAMVLSVNVATGAPTSPTPRGTFFVTDVLPQDPSGALGAWVLALDGHSDTFTEFEGGDARLAIHGTDDPSSIGRSASFGCVRVDPTTLARLAATIAPGTPVVVH